jgi:hypothetical protein
MGPQPLNYYVLLHPEVMLSKPKDGELPPQTTIVKSDGAAETLIDCIIIEKNKD